MTAKSGEKCIVGDDAETVKAVGEFADEHRRQLLNYLRITKCRLGLLVNFGAYPRVGIERYVL